jgi:DNA/RNA endonuclease YhcR with UshA esterase domain
MRTLVLAVALACTAVAAAAPPKEDKPLTPAEAIKRVNESVTVELAVKSSKNALAKRKEIYLDSEENFRDEKNLAVVITEAGATKFKDAGIADPAAHFKGKTIRVTGTVVLQDKQHRIVVDDPKQIRTVEKK